MVDIVDIPEEEKTRIKGLDREELITELIFMTRSCQTLSRTRAEDADKMDKAGELIDDLLRHLVAFNALVKPRKMTDRMLTHIDQFLTDIRDTIL